MFGDWNSRAKQYCVRWSFAIAHIINVDGINANQRDARGDQKLRRRASQKRSFLAILLSSPVKPTQSYGSSNTDCVLTTA